MKLQISCPVCFNINSIDAISHFVSFDCSICNILIEYNQLNNAITFVTYFFPDYIVDINYKANRTVIFSNKHVLLFRLNHTLQPSPHDTFLNKIKTILLFQ